MPSPCSHFDSGALSSLPSEEGFNLAATPGTRHYALLNSNEPPSDSDVALIQSVVSKADARLAWLDHEASKLGDQLQLRQLEEEGTSVVSYRTRNRAILSPIRRMPLELLGEIFAWTLPSIGEECSRGRFDLAASPWMLTRISRHWRVASLLTPSLWSRVVIDYSYAPDPSSAYPLPVLETQIQRSQKLKIHFYSFETPNYHLQIQTFVLLSQHSARWEELSLGLTPNIIPYLSALRDRLSTLKRLWIQWDGPESQTTMECIDCFQTASSLEDVAIHADRHFLPIALPIHHFHHLTRYQHDGPWEKHRSILKLAPNLVEARVIAYADEINQEPWAEPVDLLRLQRLYVSPPIILNYLRAPALEELALWLPQENVSSFLPPLHSLIHRSSCTLRRVCIGGFLEARTTTQMLQQVPAITELVIVTETDNAREEINTLMAILTLPNLPGSTAIAPHLRLIFVGCEDTSSVDYAVFLDMVRSRWKAEDCRLQSAALAINKGPRPDSATLSGLDALRREGLNFRLLEGAEAIDLHPTWFYGTRWNC